MTNNYFIINFQIKDLFLLTGLSLAGGGLIVLLGTFITHTTSGLSVNKMGRFTLRVLICGELCLLLMPIYFILFRRKEMISDSAQIFKEIYFAIVLLHILFFLLGSVGVIMHTYINYQNGQVCGWNNLLLAITLVISLSEIVMLINGWFINLPRSTLGMVGMWFYWVFVVSFIGPVLAHALTRMNSG